jgi:hypothetical protein
MIIHGNEKEAKEMKGKANEREEQRSVISKMENARRRPERKDDK